MRFRTVRSAGFTLVELLVVIAIIALLLTLVTPTLFKGRDEAYRVACLQKLREIGNSMQLYRNHHDDRLPTYSGPKFIMAPWKAKELDNDERTATIYKCPGDPYDTPIDVETKALRIADFDMVDGSMTSYSGRDTRAFPIKYGEAGSEIIACDDDENEPNHKVGVNVLYADGTPAFITYEALGVKPEDFKVGAESPIEAFRVLTNDSSDPGR